MAAMFTIQVAHYVGSKTKFAKFIRFQQKTLQGLPAKDAMLTHAEMVFLPTNDVDILSKIKGIQNIYI